MKAVETTIFLHERKECFVSVPNVHVGKILRKQKSISLSSLMASSIGSQKKNRRNDPFFSFKFEVESDEGKRRVPVPVPVPDRRVGEVSQTGKKVFLYRYRHSMQLFLM
mmetsp:Transcript_12929/g.30217  ORF Transcript_12929/g.30217 Transcript_12929/m.30217 type:complete len:109 (-) Transcript_12929:418-744(-)